MLRVPPADIGQVAYFDAASVPGCGPRVHAGGHLTQHRADLGLSVMMRSIWTYRSDARAAATARRHRTADRDRRYRVTALPVPQRGPDEDAGAAQPPQRGRRAGTAV